jgi:pimeloyl-ACP methyl ester carboxylesterase
MRQRFVFNAPTWLDELNEPGAFLLDLERLAAFDRPVLISRGDQSPPFFGAILDTIAWTLPHARRHTFEGVGHMPHLTRPDDFVSIVGGFVGAAAAAGE